MADGPRSHHVAWLARGLHEVPESDDWLSLAESARLATLRFPKRRTEVRLARWTAKQAIAQALDLDDAAGTLALIEIRAAPFAPAVLGLRVAGPVARLVSRLARRARRTGSDLFDGALAPLALPPEVTMAILHGVMVGPVAPTVDERRRVTVPALVLGHRGGFIHPFSDAAHLASELPAGRLLPTRTLLELRVRPRRLLGEIDRFLDADGTFDPVESRSGPGRVTP